MLKGLVASVKKVFVWIIVSIVILLGLMAVYLPSVLAWLMGALGLAGGLGGLAGASSANKEKREAERKATEADKKVLDELNDELAKKREELAQSRTEQQQLFVSHQKDCDQLDAEYKKMVEDELFASNSKTAQDKLDYLKSRRAK